MNLKKLFQISDHFQFFSFPKNKVVSRYTLLIVSFFVFLCVLFFNVSFKNPVSYNSVVSWSFSLIKTPSINGSFVENHSNGTFVEFGGKGYFGNFTQGNKDGVLKDAQFSNFTSDVKNGSFDGINEKNLDLGDEGYFGNFTQGNKNGVLKDTHFSNFTNDVKNGSLNGGNEKNLDLGDEGYFSNFTNNVKNESFNGGNEKNLGIGDDGHFSNFTENVKNEKGFELGDIHLSNFTNKVKNGTFESDFDSKKDSDGVLMVKNDSSSYEECDIFNGRWVRDDTKPYYKAGSCPFIDRDFDCHLNKRPDDGYVKWKWQPFGCDIPSLNATDFLERLRGKKLVFVGDSLNRNMWESLVCILRDSVPNKNKVYEISGRHEFKKKGFYAFRFEDYNCTVDFVSSVFLVQESSLKHKNGTFETLRLDLMDRSTSMYHDADVLVFNTGHWWTHEKTSKGENYYQEGDHVYPRLKVLDAYRRALSTWARWVDTNIDTNKTQVIYRGYSVTHFKGGQWNSGGKCHKETEPIFNTSHLTKYPSKMRAFDNVLRDMKSPIIYLNISRLTDYRKDGHPSIYRMEYKSVEEQIAAEQSQDCSHWCLPGVPDTWNELLYASLLKVGKGSWKI